MLGTPFSGMLRLVCLFRETSESEKRTSSVGKGAVGVSEMHITF